jgi:hypothetical protein
VGVNWALIRNKAVTRAEGGREGGMEGWVDEREAGGKRDRKEEAE